MEQNVDLQKETGELLERFPVRKRREQKAAFRIWLTDTLTEAGYPVTVEEEGKRIRSANVVVGDPDRAKVVFTAHYDTPARLFLPNFIAPRNLVLTILLQLPLIILMCAAAIGMELVVLFATDNALLGMLTCYAVLILFLVMVYAGPANPHNVNDNTSGTATLLEIALALPPELRDRAAFVFFDNEEKGMVGSSAFRKRHGGMKEKLILNFDCVSDGDLIRLFPSKELKKREELLSILEGSFSSAGGKLVEVVRGFGFYPSDQMGFSLGVGVAALHKGPVGEYLGRIHTPRDTVFEAENIVLLREGALALAAAVREDA